MFFISVSVIVLDELHIYYIANAVFVERNDVKELTTHFELHIIDQRLKLRDSQLLSLNNCSMTWSVAMVLDQFFERKFNM